MDKDSYPLLRYLAMVPSLLGVFMEASSDAGYVFNLIIYASAYVKK